MKHQFHQGGSLRPDANAQNVGSSGFMRPEPQAHPRDEELEADTE